jgi:hypothetical protein
MWSSCQSSGLFRDCFLLHSLATRSVHRADPPDIDTMTALAVMSPLLGDTLTGAPLRHRPAHP